MKVRVTVFCKYPSNNWNTVHCNASGTHSLNHSFIVLPSIYSDISNCEVVTAWAEGCSWSEALEISGSPPGDLARILSRVLDAVRQLGNLSFSAVRRRDMDGSPSAVDTVSRGIHPEVRRLCRDAARAINRYPLKDPLAFETGDEEFDEDLEDEDSDSDDADDEELLDDTELVAE